MNYTPALQQEIKLLEHQLDRLYYAVDCQRAIEAEIQQRADRRRTIKNALRDEIVGAINLSLQMSDEFVRWCLERKRQREREQKRKRAERQRSEATKKKEAHNANHR